jgi:hypothetical protein
MGADELTDWARGDSLLASHLQQPVTVLRKLLGRPSAQVGHQRLERGGFTFVVTLGKIVTSGPEGEADFTNEQYWVKPQYVEEGAQDDPITLTDITPPDEFTEDGTADPNANIKPVTNLAELKDGTHRLKEGRFVWFFAVTDGGGDGGDGPADHLLMSESADLGLIPVLVSQTGGANGDQTTAATWTYDVTDVQSNPIDTGLSPSWQRAVGRKVAASHGNGYYDPSGNFVLEQVDEVDDTGVCPASEA